MIETRFVIIACFVLSQTASLLAAETVSFSRHVAPILLEHCQSCHGPKKAEGGYRVDTYQAALEVGDSGVAGFVGDSVDDSEAFRRIVSDDHSERMPLDGDPLLQEQIDILRGWIESGAAFDGEDPEGKLAALVARNDQPNAPATYPFGVPATAVQFSSDGKRVYVSGYHELTTWNVSDGSLVGRIPNVGQRTMSLDLSSDGAWLIVGDGTPGRGGTVRVVDVAKQAVVRVLTACGDLVTDVQFSPTGDQIAAATVESGLKVINLADGKEVATIASHSDWVTCVAWSPDGKLLVTGSRDKTCKVFDVSDGDLKLTYSGHGKPVRSLVFHPNGEEVFSGGNDQKIHRWKIADGAKAAEVGFGGEVFELALAGGFLYAVAGDGTVAKVNLEDNKRVAEFKGHEDWPMSVDYHEPTNRVVSGGYDGEIRIWDPDEAKPVTAFLAKP